MVSGPERLDVNSGKPDIHPLLCPYKAQFPHWAPPTLRLGAPCLGLRLSTVLHSLVSREGRRQTFLGTSHFHTPYQV